MTPGTIYKYRLNYASQGDGTVRMPKGAKILSAESQNDEIVIYALIDTNAEIIDRHIRVIPTGVTTNGLYDMYFIGTVKLYEGALMFHVFAEKV